jgi:dinuclear metal center YbgI/SA1388 family protein
MKLQKLVKVIEEKYPLNLAYGWDNVGLLVGDLNIEIKKVLVSIEANDKLVEEAIEKDVDLIVTHHPFIFSKINRVTTSDYKGKLIHKLIKNDIAIYSTHTNFDIAFDGLNDYFMTLLGIEESTILDVTYSEQLYKLAVYVPKDHVENVRDTICDAGAGYIGNYSHCTFNIDGNGTFMPQEGTNPFIGAINALERVEEIKDETVVPQKILNNVLGEMLKSHPYEEVAYDLYKIENKGKSFGLGRVANLNEKISLEELANLIKEKLKMKHIRVVGDLNTDITRVAVVTGSGSSYVKDAKNKGAQVLITGDLKYHEAQDALDIGMTLIDCGHFESEYIFKDIMKAFLVEKVDLEVIQSEVDLNPIKTI